MQSLSTREVMDLEWPSMSMRVFRMSTLSVHGLRWAAHHQMPYTVISASNERIGTILIGCKIGPLLVRPQPHGGVIRHLAEPAPLLQASNR